MITSTRQHLYVDKVRAVRQGKREPAAAKAVTEWSKNQLLRLEESLLAMERQIGNTHPQASTGSLPASLCTLCPILNLAFSTAPQSMMVDQPPAHTMAERHKGKVQGYCLACLRGCYVDL